MCTHNKRVQKQRKFIPGLPPEKKNKVNSLGQTDYNAKRKTEIWNSVGKEIRKPRLWTGFPRPQLSTKFELKFS